MSGVISVLLKTSELQTRLQTTVSLVHLCRETVSYLWGTGRVRFAWISRLLDKWSACQLVVLCHFVGLEDLLWVLHERDVHGLARQWAGLCRRQGNLSTADHGQLPWSALGRHQLWVGVVSTLWTGHLTLRGFTRQNRRRRNNSSY